MAQLGAKARAGLPASSFAYIDSTGRRLPALIKGARFVEVKDGPHNIGWTHPEELNKAFLEFLGE